MLTGHHVYPADHRPEVAVAARPGRRELRQGRSPDRTGRMWIGLPALGRGLAGAGGRWSRPDLELVEQGRSGGRDRVDRVAERLGVMPGWGTETADLTHVLQRGGVDILVGHPLGVRRAQGLDASAHASDGTRRFTPDRAG